MDRALKPSQLDLNPNSLNVEREFKHWFATFKYFLAALPQEDLNKLLVLINFISPDIFEYVSDCGDYEEACLKLEALFIKPKNKIYARHLQAT